MLPRCDKTVRRQLKRLHGQSAWNMAESCHDNKSAVLMRAGARGTQRGKSARVCVCVSFAMRTDVSGVCHSDVDLHQTVFLDGC